MYVWKKKIRDAKNKRSLLIENRLGSLTEEEDQTNLLLKDYFDKLTRLKEVRGNIKEIQNKN